MSCVRPPRLDLDTREALRECVRQVRAERARFKRVMLPSWRLRKRPGRYVHADQHAGMAGLVAFSRRIAAHPEGRRAFWMRISDMIPADWVSLDTTPAAPPAPRPALPPLPPDLPEPPAPPPPVKRGLPMNVQALRSAFRLFLNP